MDINKLVNYLRSLYDPDVGAFMFSLTSKPTLLSTNFVLMTYFLINKKPENDINIIIKNLLKNKTSSNRFIDKLFNLKLDREHKADYIVNQFTFFTLIALDQLGYRFDELPFFKEFLEKNTLLEWFDSLKWNQFWYESNKIMFCLFFYTYILNYGNASDRLKAFNCIECAFKVLNERQDKNTGYWGTDLNNNNLPDGCFGSAHIYLFYDYFNKEIQYPEKIINNTISLHADNGLILGLEGGACEDYDAVEIYLRVTKQTDYKKDEILEKLYKMKKTIISNQDSCGGFSYKFSQNKFGLFKKKKNAKYRYSSWELMETDINKPDSWGTYFRLLTIGAIDLIFGKNFEQYNSYWLPGWGYISP